MGRPLSGSFRPPGDKSVSHRVLILSALARGDSLLSGLNDGQDCAGTRRVMTQLGAEFVDGPDGVRVRGVGGAPRPPSEVLDAGNSGTTLRLLMGVAASTPGLYLFTGDASLCGRPMDRVARPLAAMGADIWLRQERFAPLAIRGRALVPVRYELPVASAQVKSALLLAGCRTAGSTVVVETVATRDHTERALRRFGALVIRSGSEVSIEGPQALDGTTIRVPGDLSAALFLLTAAVLVDGSDVTARGVGVNPTRRAGLDILMRMGARVECRSLEEGGAADDEPLADITAGGSELVGVEIGGSEAAQAIDELPILAVAAACATGVTRIRDAAELRVKESDRISALAAGLARLGVRVEEKPDGLDIVGGGPGFRFAGGAVDTRGDHRIAMAFRVAGLRATGPVVLDDLTSAGVSDPGFAAALAALERGTGGH